MLTSIMRHNTILHKAIIGYEKDKVLLNPDVILETLLHFAVQARELTLARLHNFRYQAYNPIGYDISSEFLKDNIDSGKTEESTKNRAICHEREKSRRLKVG